MRLSLLITADVALFLIAAFAWLFQLPSNVDSPDPSPFYTVTGWVAVVALALLVVLLGALVVQRLGKRNAEP